MLYSPYYSQTNNDSFQLELTLLFFHNSAVIFRISQHPASYPLLLQAPSWSHPDSSTEPSDLPAQSWCLDACLDAVIGPMRCFYPIIRSDVEKCGMLSGELLLLNMSSSFLMFADSAGEETSLLRD